MADEIDDLDKRSNQSQLWMLQVDSIATRFLDVFAMCVIRRPTSVCRSMHIERTLEKASSSCVGIKSIRRRAQITSKSWINKIR